MAKLPRASRETMPAHIAPQLCTLVSKPPAGTGWLHEIKWDGYRLIARLDKHYVRIFTLNGHDWTDRFPNVARGIAALPVKSAFFDGELCALDARGASDFSVLKSAIGRRRDAELVFYLFDLMYLDGRDLRERGRLRERAKSYAKDFDQRYSPVRLMCSQPSGETWARRSGRTAAPSAARLLTTSPSFIVFQ